MGWPSDPSSKHMNIGVFAQWRRPRAKQQQHGKYNEVVKVSPVLILLFLDKPAQCHVNTKLCNKLFQKSEMTDLLRYIPDKLDKFFKSVLELVKLLLTFNASLLPSSSSSWWWLSFHVYFPLIAWVGCVVIDRVI